MGFMSKFTFFGTAKASSKEAVQDQEKEKAPSSESLGQPAAKIPPILSPESLLTEKKTIASEATRGPQVPIAPQAPTIAAGLSPKAQPPSESSASPAEGAALSDSVADSVVDSLETDLTELLVAIKAQVDAERQRIRDGRPLPPPETSLTANSPPIESPPQPAPAAEALRAVIPPAPAYPGEDSASSGMGDIAQAIESFNREFRQRSLSEDPHTNRLRSALQDLTQSMETLVTALPDPGITGSGWNAILLELESLAEKQRRIEEIQKAFEATMKEVEEGFNSIGQHIQESVRQERDSIETLQKRIQMAEGLAQLLEK